MAKLDSKHIEMCDSRQIFIDSQEAFGATHVNFRVICVSMVTEAIIVSRISEAMGNSECICMCAYIPVLMSMHVLVLSHDIDYFLWHRDHKKGSESSLICFVFIDSFISS